MKRLFFILFFFLTSGCVVHSLKTDEYTQSGLGRNAIGAGTFLKKRAEADEINSKAEMNRARAKILANIAQLMKKDPEKARELLKDLPVGTGGRYDRRYISRTNYRYNYVKQGGPDKQLRSFIKLLNRYRRERTLNKKRAAFKKMKAFYRRKTEEEKRKK